MSLYAYIQLPCRICSYFIHFSLLPSLSFLCVCICTMPKISNITKWMFQCYGIPRHTVVSRGWDSLFRLFHVWSCHLPSRTHSLTHSIFSYWNNTPFINLKTSAGNALFPGHRMKWIHLKYNFNSYVFMDDAHAVVCLLVP